MLFVLPSAISGRGKSLDQAIEKEVLATLGECSVLVRTQRYNDYNGMVAPR